MPRAAKSKGNPGATPKATSSRRPRAQNQGEVTQMSEGGVHAGAPAAPRDYIDLTTDSGPPQGPNEPSGSVAALPQPRVQKPRTKNQNQADGQEKPPPVKRARAPPKGKKEKDSEDAAPSKTRGSKPYDRLPAPPNVSAAPLPPSHLIPDVGPSGPVAVSQLPPQYVDPTSTRYAQGPPNYPVAHPGNHSHHGIPNHNTPQQVQQMDLHIFGRFIHPDRQFPPPDYFPPTPVSHGGRPYAPSRCPGQGEYPHPKQVPSMREVDAIFEALRNGTLVWSPEEHLAINANLRQYYSEMRFRREVLYPVSYARREI